MGVEVPFDSVLRCWTSLRTGSSAALGMTGGGEAAAPPTQVENLRYREMENGLGRRQAPAEQGDRRTTKAGRRKSREAADGFGSPSPRLRTSSLPKQRTHRKLR